MKPIIDEDNHSVSFDGGRTWTSYVQSDSLSNKEVAINTLEALMRMISIRKVEITKNCYQEKLSKPDFTDLDWMFEQIYWLKKTL